MPNDDRQLSCSNPLGTLNVFDSKSSDFVVFSERLKQFFIANGITQEDRKKAILINTLSEECYVLIRDLCVPNLPEEKTFDELVAVLTNHFSPVRSYFSERLKFYSARKNSNETISEWGARIKKLASKCGFGNELPLIMRDIFVIGINDESIMCRLFEEDAQSGNVTLQTQLKIALSKESSIKEQLIREKGCWGNGWFREKGVIYIWNLHQ